jgi:hypothetical protein
MTHIGTRSAKGWAAGTAVALGAAVLMGAPTAASAAEGNRATAGDTYTETVFDHALKGSDSESWGGKCPASHPFLDGSVGTDNLLVGKGFRIERETPSALHMNETFGLFRELTRVGTTVYYLGNGGTVTNWSVVRQHLKIEMVCTSDPNRAWRDGLQTTEFPQPFPI